MKKKLKALSKVVIFAFLALILFGLSLFLFVKSRDNVTLKNFSFNENGNINYRVFLKDNSFFDVNYFDKDDLEKNNQSIISKLIDNINIAFNYNVNFNDKVDAKYFYQIKGTILANNSDGTKNYWSKVFDLTEKKEMSLNGTSAYTIAENISINYDMYNDMFNNFKTDYSNLSSDGTLKVELIISSENASELLNRNIKFNPILKFEIPLSKASTEVSLKTLGINNADSYSAKFVDGSIIYKVYLIISILLFACSVFLFVRIIYLMHEYRIKNLYEIKLRRILNTYDGIIVNIKTLPTLKDYSVIDVKSFEELIDAHSEVRLPINYYNEKGKDLFLLVNESIVWRFDFKAAYGDL